MIYTWEINRNRQYFNLEKFTELVECVRKIIPISGVDIRDYEGNEPMTINHNQIWFNGDLRRFEHHETFSIRRIPKLNCVTEYGQCDTGDKPYDIVVAATLLMLKHHFPEKVKLYPEEINDHWIRGYDLANQVCHLEALEELL